MKVLLILSAVVMAVVGSPAGGYIGYPAMQSVNTYSRPAFHEQQSYINRPIVTGQMYSSQDTAGQYNFGYSSSDGQEKSETKEGDGDVHGSFSYTSPEGNHIKLSYKAGEEGFVAEGDHLPVEPELPAELAAAYEEAHETLRKAHEEARQRGDIEPVDTRYDDGSWRGEEHDREDDRPRISYQAPIHYQPTYSAPAPVKVFHTRPAATYAAVSAPEPRPVFVPAPVRPVTYVSAPARPISYASAPAPLVSSSYQTVLGGPVSAPLAPEIRLSAPHKKSGQILGY